MCNNGCRFAFTVRRQFWNLIYTPMIIWPEGRFFLFRELAKAKWKVVCVLSYTICEPYSNYMYDSMTFVKLTLMNSVRRAMDRNYNILSPHAIGYVAGVISELVLCRISILYIYRITARYNLYLVISFFLRYLCPAICITFSAYRRGRIPRRVLLPRGDRNRQSG